MKRICLVLSLILILALASCSATTGELDEPAASGFLLSKVITDGQVSSEYSYDGNSRLISIDHSNNAIESFEYNSQGLLVKHILQTDVFNIDITCSYDNDGILASINTITSAPAGVYDDVEELEYDTTGRIIKGQFFRNEEQLGYATYIYDENGNTAERTLYANDGSVVTQIFRYDDKINPNPRVVFLDVVEKNNIVYSRSQLSDGTTLQEDSSTFEYNSLGLPVKETRVDESGESTIIEYVYVSR